MFVRSLFLVVGARKTESSEAYCELKEVSLYAFYFVQVLRIWLKFIY